MKNKLIDTILTFTCATLTVWSAYVPSCIFLDIAIYILNNICTNPMYWINTCIYILLRFKCSFKK